MDMRESRLASAMQYLDEDLISQAEEYVPPHKKWYQNKWMKWGMLAAGILLFVLASIRLNELQNFSENSQKILAWIPEDVNDIEDSVNEFLTSGDKPTVTPEYNSSITPGESAIIEDDKESTLEVYIFEVHHNNKESATKREDFLLESPNLATHTVENNQEESTLPKEAREDSLMERKLLWIGILFVIIGLVICGIAIKSADKSGKESSNEEHISESNPEDSLQTDGQQEANDDFLVFGPPDNSIDEKSAIPLTNEGKLTMINGTVLYVDENGILIRYGEEEGNICRLIIGEQVTVEVQWEGGSLMPADISQVVRGRTVHVTYNGGTDSDYPTGVYGVLRIIVELPKPFSIIEATIEEVHDKTIVVNEKGKNGHGKLWVGTGDDVKIFVGGSKAERSQLKAGQRVLVIYSGGILESYPGQVTGELEIIAE